MKLLLDENLPKNLKSGFPGHEVFTVPEMGWAGKTNGELLKLMIERQFDVLLTFDKNLQHQQNFRKYSLMVVVLNADSNTFASLQPLCKPVLEVLQKQAVAGPVIISAKNL
jgi:hypothetical protein